MITKHKLVLDTTELADSDNVGAYLRSSDGTLITHTTVGAKEALDVNIANFEEMGVFAEDAAHASGDNGQFILAVRNDAGGSLVSADGDYAPLQVDANGLLQVAAEVTSNVEYAEDSAHASGAIGAYILGVRQDADTSPVSADGDYHGLIFDNAGRLKVAADISVVNGFEKAEDAAHASGDIGGYMLSVRQDTLASSTSADGDYQSFKTDTLGRLWANNSHQTMAHSPASVTDTATDLVATDLVNRKRIIIQNRGSKAIFVGGPTVTTANGTEIPSGASVELDIAASVNVHAICTVAGPQNVRVLELA